MKYILMLFIYISLNAQIITSDGIGSNSDKSISKKRALLDAKVQALSTAGVYIESELELIEHEKLNVFKEEIKSKILQKSEGLVSLVKVINENRCSKDSQIYTCRVTAKFKIQKSDIKNSFEIMKKLEGLSKSKIGQDEYNKLLKEIKNLKTKISNPQLSQIINKNSTKIINNIDVIVNNQIDNKIVIQNKTDEILYLIVGGLLLVIIILVFLSNRKKEIVVNIKNPNYKEIIDIKKQDENITLFLDKNVFYENEKLSINFTIKSKFDNWFIYGYNIDDKNDIVLLDLIENDTIKANTNYKFPTWSDGYDISAPFGDDIIKIFVCNKAIKKPSLEDSKSKIFTNSNTRGLSNTKIQKELSQQSNISKFDIVAYYRGFSDECEIFERSISYKTMERS